jgi:hypothetical protein
MNAKVTINESPSAELIAQAKKEFEIIDDKGRIIKLRKPGVLSQFRLVEMLGESAQNQVYVGMCLPLTYITTIDGESVTMRTKRELEALIQRLDDEGVEAVCAGVMEHFGKVDADAAKEQVKN